MNFSKDRNGILLPKVFWPTLRKNCSSDWEKCLKFEAEGWEFESFLRLLEQFIQTVKGQKVLHKFFLYLDTSNGYGPQICKKNNLLLFVWPGVWVPWSSCINLVSFLYLCFLISLVHKIPMEKQLAIRPPRPIPVKRVPSHHHWKFCHV